MIGFLLNGTEEREMEYIIRRELEEILLDMDDHRIDHVVKHVMQERYQTLFNLYRRIASRRECLKYMPKRTGDR
ncbi:hypothetical protein GCM10028778_18230 [Barrientosiimonas marina]|uniref:Uncharacterized protein n=1 Tax=Lentibacillus kimchii TaxID=1542911 RepID=A0ABW2US14_9BACI